MATYRFERNMVAQPAVTLDELRMLLQSGQIEPYTLCWAVGQSEPVFMTVGGLMAEIEREKREEGGQPFVSMVEKPILRAGEKPREYFQRKTHAELYHEALRFIAEKQSERN